MKLFKKLSLAKILALMVVVLAIEMVAFPENTKEMLETFWKMPGKWLMISVLVGFLLFQSIIFPWVLRNKWKRAHK